MYDTILVPLDGSAQAEAALPHVVALAGPFRSAVILLRVFELPILGALPPRGDDAFEALPHLSQERLAATLEEATAYLEQQAAALREQGLRSSTRVAYGPIAATIMNTAVAEDVDLIAMASHGAGNLQGVYYGSVAAGVLQRVDRPLLIVRANVD